MDTLEILKEILPLLSSAGEGVYWVAILVVMKGYFVGLMTAGTLITLVWFVVRAVANSESEAEFIREIVDTIDMDIYPPYTRTEKRRVIEKIRDYK